MLRKKNFLYTILAILYLASISLAQGGWETKAPMPTARAWLSASVVNNNIYAVGGAAVLGEDLDPLEAFDPDTNTWTTKTPLTVPRWFLSACTVDGIIYAFGGGWIPIISTMEAYNPQTNTWDTTKAPMPTTRTALSVCEVDGIIYAIGGANELVGTGLTTVEAYNPQTNQWTTKASMPTGRIAFSTSVVDGIIYAFGGLSMRGSASLNTVEAYDPTTNTWTTKTSMLEMRAGLSTAVVDNIIYAFGGVSYGGGSAISSMEKYDPATDTWSAMQDMPMAVAYPACSIVNSKIYLIGGFNSSREIINSVYQYEPLVIIPVELNSFTAELNGTKAVLKWTTASELNNHGFEIERKINGSNWNTIGFKEGSGTTTERKDYTFIDDLSKLSNGTISYRLKQVDFGGNFEYSDIIEIGSFAASYELYQNYPNPFNPNTSISYSLLEKGFVTLHVYNNLGEEVAVLVNKTQESGKYKVEFDASTLPSGVYIYSINYGAFSETKKMLLLK